MMSSIAVTFLVSVLCLGAVTSQLAPVYNKNGAAPTALRSEPPPPSTRSEPRAINTARPRRNRFITETVYGFLDFTTTVGSTVMVFTPQSEKEKEILPSSTSVAPVITATPTLEKLETTKPPPTSVKEKRVIEATALSPTTSAPSGLAKLLKEAQLVKKENPFSLSSRPLRNSYKKSESSNTKNRGFLPSPKLRSSTGGSTIVPITIEGKGGVLLPKTPVLEPSIYIPEEIVVSASQNFPPVSVIGPFKTQLNNDIENSVRYDHFASEPTPSISEEYSLSNNKLTSNKPTGLITTLGGTIISDGQTTIHKTSVIGTYVSGKYAQVLKSTSRIFQDNPLDNFITPTQNMYETVKEVIEGSATQFFNPETTASLPIESLFSSSIVRAPRYETRYDEYTGERESTGLTKRRGTNPSSHDDYYYYYDSKDQYYDDDYEDLIRAGSGVRQTYRPISTTKSIAPSTPTYKRKEPSTYRPRVKSTGTRNIPPSFLRNSPPPARKNSNRFQLPLTRPKLKVNRKDRPSPTKSVPPKKSEPIVKYPSSTNSQGTVEETVRVVTSKPVNGPTDVWYEIITLRTLHAFRVGTTKNTRHVTYTKTFTHSIEPTSALELASSEGTSIYEKAPLFENILDDKESEIATLPPINIDGKDLNTLLKTTTETFRTTETMYKTSVLPLKQNEKLYHHTLTQTYLITRIVSAIKTIPPVEAFDFIPGDSLNEFNDKLIAEGTENEAALLPGEREYDENKETRVPPPSGFKLSGSNLEELAGGKFSPEALEKQMNPQLAAAITTHKKGGPQELLGTKQALPNTGTAATPALSPEALQLAYLRLMNPYMFGGFPGAQTQQATVTSAPVVITTDVTTTSTRVLRVILNARPILTTISSTGVVQTTITTYTTTTLQAQPALGGLPFAFPAPLPFAAG